jgi:UDP-glucose:(heptosyl)LPS alpha-1,3-glucosyltransferase
VAAEVAGDYRVARQGIRVLYNGVDLERFHPARRADVGGRVRARLGLGTRPVCLAVGTGFERKGFDVLLAAWRRGAPRGAVLVIAGGDERLGAYRAAAAEPALAGNVHVLGVQADVEELFAAADVLCLPSRQEAFGNVVLEAAAAGVPIVASDAVGATELFCGSAACAVVQSPAQEADILRAVGDILDDGWGERSHEARRLAECHPWTAHLDSLDAFLREVADGA